MRKAVGTLIYVAAFPVIFFGGQWLLGIHLPANVPLSAGVSFGACVLAAFLAGMVAHELGHAVAVVLAGEKVLGVELGGRLLTFHIGSVPVSVGLGLGGWVRHSGDHLTPGRDAIIAAAGPAANAVAALCCLLLPFAHWESESLALAVLGSALQDLAPIEVRGHRSDGSRLLDIPSRRRAEREVSTLLADPGWLQRADALAILLNGFALGVTAAEDCFRELARRSYQLPGVYRQPWSPPRAPSVRVLVMVTVLTRIVLVIGKGQQQTLELAVSRAEWVLDRCVARNPPGPLIPEARLTLALGRLRQGRPEDARRLCSKIPRAELDVDDCAMTLAVVALSRHALGLDGRPQVAEALTLNPNAMLVPEAARVIGACSPAAQPDQAQPGNRALRSGLRHAAWTSS
jgi:peptidase M50-like protein